MTKKELKEKVRKIKASYDYPIKKNIKEDIRRVFSEVFRDKELSKIQSMAIIENEFDSIEKVSCRLCKYFEIFDRICDYPLEQPMRNKYTGIYEGEWLSGDNEILNKKGNCPFYKWSVVKALGGWVVVSIMILILFIIFLCVK